MWQNAKEVLSFIVLTGSGGGVLWGIYLFVRFLDDLYKENKEQKEERYLIIKGLFAALNGLEQQGANGPVTKAREQLEKYLTKKAIF